MGIYGLYLPASVTCKQNVEYWLHCKYIFQAKTLLEFFSLCAFISLRLLVYLLFLFTVKLIVSCIMLSISHLPVNFNPPRSVSCHDYEIEIFQKRGMGEPV